MFCFAISLTVAGKKLLKNLAFFVEILSTLLCLRCAVLVSEQRVSWMEWVFNDSLCSLLAALHIH